WLQIPFLLLIGAEHGEDFGVATVRSLATEHNGTESGSTELLIDIREFDRTEALAAQVSRQVRRPQPRLFDILLQATDQFPQRYVLDVIGRVLVVIVDIFERIDPVADEGLHPVELLLEVRID